MSVKLLIKHHFEFLSLKGGCTGLSESTLVKIPNCWKSHVMSHCVVDFFHYNLLSGCHYGTFFLFQLALLLGLRMWIMGGELPIFLHQDNPASFSQSFQTR